MSEVAQALELNLESPSDASALDMEEAHQNLVDEFVRIRKARGLSMQNVADELQISRQAVSKIERANRDPRLSTLIRYAMAIGAHITLDARPVEEWFSDNDGTSRPRAPSDHRATRG